MGCWGVLRGCWAFGTYSWCITYHIKAHLPSDWPVPTWSSYNLTLGLLLSVSIHLVKKRHWVNSGDKNNDLHWNRKECRGLRPWVKIFASCSHPFLLWTLRCLWALFPHPYSAGSRSKPPNSQGAFGHHCGCAAWLNIKVLCSLPSLTPASQSWPSGTSPAFQMTSRQTRLNYEITPLLISNPRPRILISSMKFCRKAKINLICKTIDTSN